MREGVEGKQQMTNRQEMTSSKFLWFFSNHFAHTSHSKKKKVWTIVLFIALEDFIVREKRKERGKNTQPTFWDEVEQCFLGWFSPSSAHTSHREKNVYLKHQRWLISSIKQRTVIDKYIFQSSIIEYCTVPAYYFIKQTQKLQIFSLFQNMLYGKGAVPAKDYHIPAGTAVPTKPLL